jgi:hypothetical protein
MMAGPRIPFEYTLIDKRHKPFVEGKRNVLITPVHFILNPGFLLVLFFGGMGLFFFLWQGIGGLAHYFSVRNDWIVTDATIVSIVPVQHGDRFNWYYFYTFQTEDGQQESGKIVEKSRTVFREGQQIPVRYLSKDPTENVYALEKMPKSVLYWVFFGIGSLWTYTAVKLIYRHFLTYRTIQAVSRRGRIVPGEIIAVHFPPPHSNEMNVKLEYTITPLTSANWKGRDLIPLIYLVGNPKPGIAVALWWAQDGTVVVL